MNKKFALLLIVCLIFICLTQVTFAKSDSQLVKPIQTYVLPSGQTLIIKEVHTNPIVVIDTWIKTGSINEDEKNNGVSHFLEHLLFKGTERHHVGEIDQIIESKGANFNAATSKDYTHFYITIGKEYFDLALDLHADMLLNAQIPEDELKRERKVVIEEIGRSEDSPSRQVFYGLTDLMFKKHPYKFDTLGTADIIGTIPRENILDYYKKWYIPSNMTTVIVGDVKTEDVIKSVKKYFAGQDSSTKTTPIYAPEPLPKKPSKKIVKGDYKQAYMELGFRSATVKDLQDSYALDVAAIILGQGRSSRLYKLLKQEKNIVNSVSVSNMTLKDAGIFVFDFDLQPENIKKVKELVFQEIQNLKENSITPEELKRAKNQVARDFIYDNESIANIAISVGYNVVIANLEEYLHYVEKINAVTIDDVKKVANQYLDTNTMATSILLPNGSNIADNKAKKPSTKKQEVSVKNDNQVQKFILSNSITLLLKPNPVNDVVSTSVFIKGGKLNQKKPGLAELTTNLLLKGTKSRTASDIALETEELGINLNASATDDYLNVTVKSTKDDFTEAMMVLFDVLKNCTFDQTEIDKVKKSMALAIKANEDSPLSYAIEKLLVNLYQGHPYGQVGELILNQLPDIKRKDILDYYQTYFSPSNIVITIVGNISPEIAKNYVEQFWAGDNKSIDQVTVEEAPEIKENVIIKNPKKTETSWISIGWLASDINSKEYATLKVIDSILGGGLSSRLYKEIREKKGLAYSVGSFYPSRLDKSSFVMYIGTNPKNIKEVLTSFEEQLDILKTQPVPEEEVKDAIQKLVGKFALSHETNLEQAFYLGWFESIGLGYEFDDKFPELIKQVTAQDIKEVSNKIFNKPYITSIVAPEKYLEEIKND